MEKVKSENEQGLNEKAKEKIDNIVREHERIRTPLIQILHKVQEEFGFIPPEIQNYLSKKLKISQSEIYGVVSFYSFFDMNPKGEHIINVCTGTACYIKGAEDLIQAIGDKYDIELGETSEDEAFTLSSARCMGCCSLAPVAMIDEEVYGNLAPARRSHGEHRPSPGRGAPGE